MWQTVPELELAVTKHKTIQNGSVRFCYAEGQDMEPTASARDVLVRAVFMKLAVVEPSFGQVVFDDRPRCAGYTGVEAAAAIRRINDRLSP